MMAKEGLEPSTFALLARRSNRLSYSADNRAAHIIVSEVTLLCALANCRVHRLSTLLVHIKLTFFNCNPLSGHCKMALLEGR